MQNDRSGLSTILAVLVIVAVVIIASAAVYVIFSNDDNDAEEKELAPGTVLSYDVAVGPVTIAFEECISPKMRMNTMSERDWTAKRPL